MAANDSGRTRERLTITDQAIATGSHPHVVQNDMQCERCGTSNPSGYRFCGSCGRLLKSKPAPVGIDRVVTTQASPVSGPSFLGLGESVDDDQYTYLLDEEPPRRVFGTVIFSLLFLMLIGAAAYAAYWKFYFVPEDHVTASASLPSAPAFAYERTPPSLTVDPAEIPLPSRHSTDQKSLESLATLAKPSAEKPAVAPSTGSVPKGTESDEEADETPSPSAKLLADGEKYLYGRGVPSNCKQAVKSFEAAADMNDAKAMSRMGSLYASGRCVKFDRVQAYQWFAKARNADPNDTWSEASMDMIWRSMNRTERAAILK
jgi:hypothetical protein